MKEESIHKLFNKGKREIIQRTLAMYFIKNYIMLHATKTTLYSHLYSTYQIWLAQDFLDYTFISLPEFLELLEFRFDISIEKQFLPLITSF